MDWTKVTEQFVGYQTFPGPGASAFTNEVVQIATGLEEISDATKNLHTETEVTKDTIDTSDTVFSDDDKKVYNKVQRL